VLVWTDVDSMPRQKWWETHIGAQERTYPYSKAAPEAVRWKWVTDLSHHQGHAAARAASGL